MKLYKLRWTNEGIMWRRGGYVILRPSRANPGIWGLRKVGSAPGKQAHTFEGDFTSEKEAFQEGNKAVRRDR